MNRTDVEGDCYYLNSYSCLFLLDYASYLYPNTFQENFMTQTHSYISALHRAAQRALWGALVAVVCIACGSGGSGDSSAGAGSGNGSGNSGGNSGTDPKAAFTQSTPTLNNAPGSEITYCYYFHLPPTQQLIKKFKATLPPNVVDATLFITETPAYPDGTLSTADCSYTAGGSGGGFYLPTFVYRAVPTGTGTDEMTLPSDDGTGKPVAIRIDPNQPAFLQVHLFNTTTVTVTESVKIEGFGYEPGTDATLAGAFVVLNTFINIPPGTSASPGQASASGSCGIPRDWNFFRMTTAANKQAVHTSVKDGTTTLVALDDARSSKPVVPVINTWVAPNFFKFKAEINPFTSQKFSYRCDYSNPNNYTIHTGSSIETDEQCMAFSYYFPNTHPFQLATLCINSLTVN
jgi:hypothetical protein